MRIGRLSMIGLIVLAASPAFAAPESCRSIAAEKERLACFDRAAAPAQGSQRQAKAKEAGSRFVDPVDSLKAENDKVSARLKGICRGC
jgi:type VI secretion system VasI family protein